MIEMLTGKRETIIYEKKIPIRMHYNIDPEDFPLHWQYSFEIIMPLENEYTLNIEQSREILNPGDIIIIAPGVIHSIAAPPEGKRYILLVNPSMFEAMADAESLRSCFYPYAVFSQAVNSSCRQSLSALLHEIWYEYSSEKPLKYIALSADIMEFFVLAGRNNSTQFLQKGIVLSPAIHKYTDRFQSICTYIAEHCTDEISLEELAAVNGFSLSHFNRLFKQFTGISYHSFLNQARITKSKNLLCQHSDMTVVDISLYCGFSSLSTFNRTFKAITKLTPSEYRDLQGN